MRCIVYAKDINVPLRTRRMGKYNPLFWEDDSATVFSSERSAKTAIKATLDYARIEQISWKESDYQIIYLQEKK